MTRLILLLALAGASLASAGELTFVDWNVLNFPGSYLTVRAPYFRQVIEAMDPDVIVGQEFLGVSGPNEFMDEVLEMVHPGEWEAASFHDGYDTDNALFIRNACVEEVGYGWVDTALRDIDWWDLRIPASEDTFRVYSLHLKASQGSDNEYKRLQECQHLRANLDALPENKPYLVPGDFNIYKSTEAAFQLLISAGAGQLHDPIDQIGYWHNNASYAAIHTQCPRSTQFQGGSYGGMDDRFDMILVSEHWLDGAGLEMDTASYTAYGNDGEHYNQSIIEGGFNNAVPYEIAEAIHYSSDHVPLLVTLNYEDATDAPATAAGRAALRAWPNPFNPRTTLRLTLAEDAFVDLAVYDTAGRRVAQLYRGLMEAGEHEIPWCADGLASGIYLASLATDEGLTEITKLVLLQ